MLPKLPFSWHLIGFHRGEAFLAACLAAGSKTFSRCGTTRSASEGSREAILHTPNAKWMRIRCKSGEILDSCGLVRSSHAGGLLLKSNCCFRSGPTWHYSSETVHFCFVRTLLEYPALVSKTKSQMQVLTRVCIDQLSGRSLCNHWCAYTFREHRTWRDHWIHDDCRLMWQESQKSNALSVGRGSENVQNIQMTSNAISKWCRIAVSFLFVVSTAVWLSLTWTWQCRTRHSMNEPPSLMAAGLPGHKRSDKI